MNREDLDAFFAKCDDVIEWHPENDPWEHPDIAQHEFTDDEPDVHLLGSVSDSYYDEASGDMPMSVYGPPVRGRSIIVQENGAVVGWIFSATAPSVEQLRLMREDLQRQAEFVAQQIRDAILRRAPTSNSDSDRVYARDAQVSAYVQSGAYPRQAVTWSEASAPPPCNSPAQVIRARRERNTGPEQTPFRNRGRS